MCKCIPAMMKWLAEMISVFQIQVVSNSSVKLVKMLEVFWTPYLKQFPIQIS